LGSQLPSKSMHINEVIDSWEAKLDGD
jgi:hypothetical protein